MPAAISKDVRERAVAAWERGEGSQQQVAVMFGVTVASVGRWVRAKKARGSVAPIAYKRGPASKVTAEIAELIFSILVARPDYSQPELAVALESRGGPKLSKSTIGRVLRRAGWTRKKNSSGRWRWTRSASRSFASDT